MIEAIQIHNKLRRISRKVQRSLLMQRFCPFKVNLRGFILHLLSKMAFSLYVDPSPRRSDNLIEEMKQTYDIRARTDYSVSLSVKLIGNQSEPF